jgi:hypothetical protein
VAWDWKLIEILISAAPDCGPQPGGTSQPLGWPVIARGGGRQIGAADMFLTKILKMDVKTSFSEMSKVQKDSEDISAGRDILL